MDTTLTTAAAPATQPGTTDHQRWIAVQNGIAQRTIASRLLSTHPRAGEITS